ncbi:hypothetical protein HYH02_006198 [Chlamydomonas schloesseri]|uniref:Uncharacterized protein n=1 Tax=Chlamydomonas schloesseri TaxID=2026947 RepID=A0A835WK28_9CHLO|nr:hypothetical protein HYH02_006198 [Chlamydomonas schloesseri]|eukprot:KAG2448847.1 hypothetical protein HYH02_006198 [Chlamydomonas schloesseri]
MFPRPGERVHDRQRGRINALRQLDEAAAREAQEKRLELHRRVARRAFEHQVMLETIELEKELEARRCKLCDLLRAEAWGLGHPNWTERRCGQCWVELAGQLSLERHGPGAAPPPPRPPPAAAPVIGSGRPRSAGRQPQLAQSRPHHPGSAAAPAGQSPQRHAAGAGLQVAPGPSAAELFQDVPAEQVDEVLAALRARDADKLMQLLDERSLQRHFGLQNQQEQQTLGRLSAPNPRAAAPHPEAPRGRGGVFYHDEVLTGLFEEADRKAAEGSEGEGSAHSVASSAVADAGGRWESGGGGRSPARGRQSPGDEREGRGSGGGSGSGADTEEDVAGEAVAARSRRRSVESGGADGQAEEELSGSEISLAHVAARTQPADGAGEDAAGAKPGPTASTPQKTVRLAVAGHVPAPRPLPSKPKAMPTGLAEMREALKQAEQMVVFGRTQHDRSTALFYSHQLRAALADLARLERRGRKSEAVHRHGLRLDTRDADGIKRIIREGRPERPPSPTTLRRWTNPDSFYTDPPRRTPRWLEHVHPDRTNPAKQADAVPWRPASAHPPAPRHTAGLQSVGDWSEYRYEWDLAAVRSMRVDDCLSSLRKQREYRSALAGLQARVLAQLPPDARELPSRYGQQQAEGLQDSFLSQAQPSK